MPYEKESKAWWHVSDDGLPSQESDDNFRIYPSEDFDIVLKPFEVAVKSAYGPELVRRTFGAQLSILMQLRSVDYTLKHYVPKDFPNSVERDRCDEEILKVCALTIESGLNKIRSENDHNKNGRPVGRVIGDATLARIPFSLRQAFTMANRGALFECLCIIRMIMEQCAWAFKITELTDSVDVEKIQGNKVIVILNTAHPSAGRFYSWLSSHAHWHFNAHGKAFAHVDKYGGSILRSRSFKMLSFGALMVLTEIVHRCLRTFRMPNAYSEAATQGGESGTLPDLKSLFENLVNIEDFEEELDRLKSFLLDGEVDAHA